MNAQFQEHLARQLADIRATGLFKSERVIASHQKAHITTTKRSDVLNLCANNYLGLADHPQIVAAAHRALDEWGYGLASVRFICGTQQPHKQLEAQLSRNSSGPTMPSSIPRVSTPMAGCLKPCCRRKTP